jgi:hypothetical protein
LAALDAFIVEGEMPSLLGSLVRRHPVLFGGLLWGLLMAVVDAASDFFRGYGWRADGWLVSVPIALVVGWVTAWLINRG